MLMGTLLLNHFPVVNPFISNFLLLFLLSSLGITMYAFFIFCVAVFHTANYTLDGLLRSCLVEASTTELILNSKVDIYYSLSSLCHSSCYLRIVLYQY